MPIYEYVCKKCENHFEVLNTSAKESDIVNCPRCLSLEVKKTLSSSNFRMSSGSRSIPGGLPSGCPSNSRFS
ncbi:MAG: zinc ribbon domain-containing protein [Candidatus Electrothrix sp. AUS1_2]|nr:zinc ribbon domain-containing protein [Candidatus Electrothrix sp. AUS1_2]